MEIKKERGHNLILMGENVDPTPEAVSKKLHDLVGITVKESSINYAVKLRLLWTNQNCLLQQKRQGQSLQARATTQSKKYMTVR